MKHSQALQKKTVKHKLRNQLSDDQLQIFSLTDIHNQIFWEEEGKEFYYKGEMFDVVRTKKENGKILLYCINDRKEKELVNNYNALTKQNSSTDKKGKLSTYQFIILFLEQNESFLNNFLSISSPVYVFYNASFQNIIMSKTSPPPKV